ncbi:MAG: PEP-CTERM sorting domain-containing protein [Phycisphaerae bacterium]|nr:PEP-CTERM sorting domain-containing protein [Phycisphaerae bacterium]
MNLARILVNNRFFCALTLTIALTLAGGTAQATPIDGSIAVGAYATVIDGPDLASSTLFTPLAPAPATMYYFGGTGDLAGIPALAPVTASGPLDITDPLVWTFSSPEGTWTTETFSIDVSELAGGYLDFFLTGVFTPAGPLAGLEPASAELRISLNQGGPVVSWGGSMTMTGPVIPEPMTMSILGVGGLALLRRRRRS